MPKIQFKLSDLALDDLMGIEDYTAKTKGFPLPINHVTEPLHMGQAKARCAIMVVPLASAATQEWPVCKGSLRASRPAAICGVAISCNGTTIASRARLAYNHRATRCGAICG